MKYLLYRYYVRDTSSHENFPLILKYLKQLEGIALWTR